MVVLRGVATFQGIGDDMAKEFIVSSDRIFTSVTVIVVVTLGAKLAQVEEKWLDCT